MERPAVIMRGNETIAGLKFGRPGRRTARSDVVAFGRPGHESGLLSRYTVFRTMGGSVVVLQDKFTGERIQLSMRDLDEEMLETEAGFVEALERLLMAKRCISCGVELEDEQFGICSACHAERLDVLLGLQDALRR